VRKTIRLFQILAMPLSFVLIHGASGAHVADMPITPIAGKMTFLYNDLSQQTGDLFAF
jgi:hypothetical protein